MRFAPILLAFMAIAACSSAPPMPPAPPAQPPVVMAPPPAPSLVRDPPWTEGALTPGDWVYREDDRGSLALFGPTGADARLLLRCDNERRKLFLSAVGQFAPDRPGSLTIRTSSTLRVLAAANTGGEGRYVAVELAPTDAILDAMAFSRGRFAVQGLGAMLIVPPWPEVSRVIEDCRSA